MHTECDIITVIIILVVIVSGARSCRSRLVGRLDAECRTARLYRYRRPRAAPTDDDSRESPAAARDTDTGICDHPRNRPRPPYEKHKMNNPTASY